MLILWTGMSCVGIVQAQSRPEKPNFVIIYADDLGWQDPTVYDLMETNVVNGFGGTNVFDTPYMDALATEGVLFRQAYSPACVCAPSRAALLSGQHPARLNFTTVSGGAICPQPAFLNSRMMAAYHNRRLEVEEVTLPRLLATHDYFNGHIGKWHLDGPGALDHDFHTSNGHRGETIGMPNRLTGFATTNAADPYQLQDITGQPSTNGFAFDQTTQNALNFLAEAAATNKPFFCYFATYLVHAPWHIRTERLLKKYADRMGYPYPLTGAERFAEGQNHPFYAAMVETFDYNLHQVLNYLRNTDDPRWPGHMLIENTYIFLTSDNGGMEYGDPKGRVTDNYPLDEGKINQEEGGTRVPFIAVGPGIPTNETSDVMVNGLDLMPTVLTLAGIPVPAGLDGLDLSGLLLTDPQDAHLVTNEVGEVRDTMYWHFPHSGEDSGTIRKGGWKLFHNYDHVENGSKNPYRLYQLYDTNGAPVDREEMVDLWNTETEVTAALGAELHSWLAEVGANVPHYNPKYGGGNLPNQGRVPAAIAHGGTGSVVWVEYETDQAAVVRVDLLYTLEGDGVDQDWFRLEATITEPGRAEAIVPDGTTHYLFNLIDENNFLVSYPDVGTIGDGVPDSAFAFSLIDRRYVNPGPQDIMYDEDFSSGSLTSDTSLKRNSVGFVKGTSSAWRIDNGVLRNTSLVNSTVSEGAVSCVIDLSGLEDPSVDEFTLSFDVTMAEFTEAVYVHVWGYVDHSSTETTSMMNLGAQNGNAWEKASPDWMTGYNFGNPNGVFIGTEGIASDAAVAIPGFFSSQTYTETFDLSGYTSAPNTLGSYDYLVLGFARSIKGAAPALTIDNVKVTVPTSDAYAQWAYDRGLGTVAANTAENLNTVTAGGLLRDDEGWRKSSGSAWTVTDGWIANSSLRSDFVAEGSIAQILDLSTFSNLNSSELSLDFEYSMATTSETLHVHLWGFVENATTSSPTTFIMNLEAQNGNAWESTDGSLIPGTPGPFDDYNLGGVNGSWTNRGSSSAGQAQDAALILTGSAGVQTYSNTFDLSGFTTPPKLVSGYDYLAIGFARNTVAGSAVYIRNLVLAVPGGDAILEFVQGPPADDREADPDGDGVVNLAEFALGGNPIDDLDVGMSPTVAVNSGGSGEYIYPRRVDAGTQGLSYLVECSTNLQRGVWSTNGCTETGAESNESGFEQVTNRVDLAEPTTFVRLRLEMDE